MLLLLLLGIFGTAYSQPAAGSCICLSSDGVNVRDSPCGNVIGSASTGACYTGEGGSTTCNLGGTNYEFWSVTFGTQTGWIANDYLSTEPDTRCQGCSGFTLVTRAQWGARPPTSTTGLGQTDMYFVHHTAGGSCSSNADCEAEVRAIQNFHMDGNGWSDIGYNFLIGGDGRAYEGRGWDVQGAHAGGWNGVSHGICMIGTFTSGLPTSGALDTLEGIMACGIDQGHVSASYSLHGHRDGVATECPGQALYDLISTWPNFGGPLFAEEGED